MCLVQCHIFYLKIEWILMKDTGDTLNFKLEYFFLCHYFHPLCSIQDKGQPSL